MKLKAVLYKKCPRKMLEAIHSNAFKQTVLSDILEPCLHLSKKIGPAEFYMQMSDLAISDEAMCVVNLTGVSLSESRSTRDFKSAVEKLQSLYIKTLAPHLKDSDGMQIFTILALDGIPYGLNSTLILSLPPNTKTW